jgi:hypothetical protein
MTNGGYGEVDYNIRRGLALAGRYDRLNQDVTGGLHPTTLEQWQAGVERTLTSTGNIVGRISVGNSHGIDPLALTGSATRTFEADIQFDF